jgi:hypothetical protein
MFPPKTKGSAPTAPIAIPKADAGSFRGIVGRQSKSATGHQGVHHHPMKAQLGNALAKGLKPGGFVKKPAGPTGY